MVVRNDYIFDVRIDMYITFYGYMINGTMFVKVWLWINVAELIHDYDWNFVCRYIEGYLIVLEFEHIIGIFVVSLNIIGGYIYTHIRMEK